MRKRKSPIRHRVSSHKRRNKTVSSYMRGNGPALIKISKTRIHKQPKELAMGIKVEMEHTTNPKIAEKIARDHLREFPDYYTRLLKMEEEAKRNLQKGNPHNDKHILCPKCGQKMAYRYSEEDHWDTYWCFNCRRIYYPVKSKHAEQLRKNHFQKPKQEIKLKVPKVTKITVTEKNKNHIRDKNSIND